jgi:hypothetical protein
MRPLVHVNPGGDVRSCGHLVRVTRSVAGSQPQGSVQFARAYFSKVLRSPPGELGACGRRLRSAPARPALLARDVTAVNSTPPTSQYGETFVASSSRPYPAAAGCADGGWRGGCGWRPWVAQAASRMVDSLLPGIVQLGCKIGYGAPMLSISVCPICQGRTKQSRSVGDLTVASAHTASTVGLPTCHGRTSITRPATT